MSKLTKPNRSENMFAYHMKIVLISASLIALASFQPVHAEDRIAHLRYLGSAELNWQTQKKDEALIDMDKCIEAYSGNGAAYALRASMRTTVGNNRGALDDCNRALYLKPDLQYVLQIRAAAKAALEDYNGAIEDLNTVMSKRNPDAKLFLARAEIYMMADNENLSRKDLDKVLELDPSNGKAKKELLIWYLQFKKYRDSLPLIEKYVASNPKSAEAYYFLARAHEGNGQNKKAIEDCTQCIKLDPKFYRAFTSRAYNKIILKDYEGSFVDSDSSIKLNPKNAIPVQNKALAYFLLGNYLKAADFYKSAAALYDKQDRKVKSRLLAVLMYKLAGNAKEAQIQMALAKKESENTKFITLAAYMEGSTKDDKVIAVSPDKKYQRAAKTMMALELLRLKKATEARSYFNWVIANGDSDEDELYISKAFLDRKSF